MREKVKCLRCGHEWIPIKSGTPNWCPNCKSPYWNKERSNEYKERRE